MRLADVLILAGFPILVFTPQPKTVPANITFHKEQTPAWQAPLPPSDHGDPKAGISYCPCTVSHDGLNMTLPFFSNNASATAFYSYSNPLGSCANSGFEQSEHLILMLYEDTNTGDVSFIFIADEPNDGSGGTMDVTFSCMPNSAYIALQDDAGELTGSPPTFTGDFFWDQCCTDGGIISGLGCGYSFTFDIDNLTGIDVITLLYGSPANPVYVNIPSSECPFIINCGGQACCENNFTLEGVVENANCEITAEGTIDLEIAGDCLQDSEFEWSNGEETEDLSGLSPGSYTVTVTDANGCSAEETFTVGVEFANPVPEINGPPWLCEGEIIQLSVNGIFTTYVWSNGENSAEIFVANGGTYSVTVTNEGGCTGTASYILPEYPAPKPVITGPLEICPGGVIELNGSPGFALYEWSNGGYAPATLITDPGFYTLVVTSDFGCTGEATVEVVGLIGPDPFIFGPDSLCAGQTGILELDAGYDTYLWSTGDTIPQIGINAPGIYSVTVTNNEACPGIASWEVHNRLAIPLTITGDTIDCAGDSTLLTGGGAFTSYLWSTGDSTFQIHVMPPGTFTLAVVDAFGCRDTAALFIDTFPKLQFQISGDATICKGDSALLYAGAGYNAYLWSTGEVTDTVLVNTSGNYAVTILDNNGCRSADTMAVAVLPVDSSFLFTTSCNPQDTGVFLTKLVNQFGCDSLVTRTVTYNLADTTSLFLTTCNPQNAGVSIQHYLNQYGCDSVVISNTSLLPSTVSLLAAQSCDPGDAGQDTLHLFNQWGCDSTVIIETTYIPADTIIVPGTTCDPQLADTTMTLLSNQNGCDSLVIEAIMLLPTSTELNVFYSCNPLDTGTVIFPFLNQYGCDSTIIQSTVLVSEDSCILRVQALVEPGACAGDPGGIQLVSDLGAFPVLVSWSLIGTGNWQNGSWPTFFTPFNITNLPDGAYALDLIDANGYTWTDTVYLTSPLPLTATLIPTLLPTGFNIACAGDSTASLSVNYISGGTLPLTMAWSTGSNAPSIDHLSAGSYTVTLSDFNGCQLVLTELLTAPPAIQASWAIAQDPCDGIPAIVQNGAFAGGVPPLIYSVNGNDLPDFIWPALPAGSVLLEVRDVNGCQKDTILFIKPEGIFSVDLGPNQYVEEGKLITLLADIVPDTITVASIKWSPELCASCLNPPLIVKETTTVTITITSAAGCTATDYVLIEIDSRNIYIPNSFSPNYDGLNDLFAPQGDPEVRVMDFLIFDRWGDEVYRSGGFQLGDPVEGWDGFVRDKIGNVDVYVYALVLRWPDGQERLYKGDLQLMR